jgi:signal transduction histidine kinase
VRDSERFVRLTVEDFGIGIPDALLEQIFDPFFTTKAQGQAAGLGLSISHGIVVEHGGMISVESDPTSTRFHVDLPAASYSRSTLREAALR